MSNLYCNCYHGKGNLLAKYTDTEVEIKCKHGNLFVLRVINGKLTPIQPDLSGPKIRLADGRWVKEGEKCNKYS